MSFGGSPGDILKAIDLAIKIYDYGFAEENRADVRYSNFRNEILNFRILLGRLDEALRAAQDRYSKRGGALARKVYEPLSQEFETERKTIIGNFYGTLEECDALLRKVGQIYQRTTSVWENFQFNLRQQEVRIDLLRQRLHFHAQKIRLVIDRLSLNLLTDLDAKVDDILAISEQNLQVSNEIRSELKKFKASWLGYISDHRVPVESAFEGRYAVSTNIAERLYQNLLHGAPSDLQKGIPLREGFDALLLLFESSSEGTDQTPERYLMFLKARWLLERLQEGPEFKEATAGYYYKRAVNQIEHGIAERIAEPGELISYDDTILLELPLTCFHIWPPEDQCEDQEISQPSPLMLRGKEVQVAHISLAPSSPSSVDAVTVFKSTEEHFRIVQETNPASAQGRTVITPHKIHVREDKLIPYYALPTLTNPCLELAVFSRNEEEPFRFSSLEDLHEFQTALMGYEVSYDHGDRPVRCQLKFKHNPTVQDASGRAQLWQEPVAPTSHNFGSVSEGSSPSLRTHPTSHGSQSRHDSLASSVPASSTINFIDGGLEASPIRLPSIAVFTQLTEKKKTSFALIQVVLEPGMFINPNSCSCHRGYDTCANLVIEHARKPHFMAYVLESDSLVDGKPNPSTFDIFPMRLPRRPDFNRTVEGKQTEYVLLKFKTLEEKRKFHDEIDLRFQVRETQLEEQRVFEQRFIREAEKSHQLAKQKTRSPVGSLQPPSAFGQRMNSMSSPRHSRTNSSLGSFSTSPSTRTAPVLPNTIPDVGLGLSDFTFTNAATTTTVSPITRRDTQGSETDSAMTVRRAGTTPFVLQTASTSSTMKTKRTDTMSSEMQFESSVSNNRTKDAKSGPKKTPFWKKL